MRKLLLVLAVLVVCVIAGLSLFGANSTVILDEVLQGKPIGVLAIIPPEQMPEEYRNTGELWAKYTPLDPDKKPIPADGSYKKLVGEVDILPGCKDQVVSAGVWFHAFMPSDPSKMAGDKVAVYTMGLYGVGPCGVINTKMEPDSEYNPKFQPDDPSRNIWNIPNCWLRLRLFGGGDFQTSCVDAGFYPTDVVGGLGPSPRSVAGSNGIFIYYAYVDGVWPHALDNQVLADLSQPPYSTNQSLWAIINTYLQTGRVPQ
jgi:hypothetical protein